MYQYDDPTVASTLPAPAAPGTAGYFTDGDPVTATPATALRSDFMNMIMMELLNVVQGGGLTPSKTTYTQVLTAIENLIQAAVAANTAIARGMFAPVATNPAGMTVVVGAGWLPGLGGTVTQIAAQTTPAFVAPAANPRIDRIVIDEATAALSVIAGAEAVQPVPPAMPAGKLPVAQVALQPTSAAIAAAMITDERDLPALGLKTLAFLDPGAGFALDANGNLTLKLADGTLTLTAAGLAVNPAAIPQIQSVTASVAANALTVGLDPTTLAFRSATLTDGTISSVTIPSALSLTVPSGATLGTVNGVQANLTILALNNAGTVELGIVNMGGGVNLDETTLVSTTAIGAAATAANVIYSDAALSSVPFRVVGYIAIAEAAAGTWATGPTLVQGAGGQAIAAMQSLGVGQTWQAVTASRALGATYYNTTARPIAVHIVGNQGTVGGFSILPTIDGVTLTYGFYGDNGTYGWADFIVPPGASYVVTGDISIAYWDELR